jgi:hypothetical protein
MAWTVPKVQKNIAQSFLKLVDHETWIWHAFFGIFGSYNDISVLQRLPLMTHIALGEGTPMGFEANIHKYDYVYYHADGTYPRWCTFKKPVAKPKGKKKVDFHNTHAAARKEV